MIAFGLENPGNLCYLNAVIQALIHIPEFTSMELIKTTLVDISPNNLQSSGSLKSFIQTFVRHSNKKHFSSTVQCDPLEALHDILTEISKSSKDISLFTYQIQNFEKSQNLFLPIQVRVRDKGILFTNVQRSIDNKLETMKINKFPKVLIISINRFAAQNSQIDINEKLEFKVNNNTFSYNLVSTICRTGNRKNGHAYTYSNMNTEKWTLYNDAIVSNVDKGEYKRDFNQNSILLFYYLTEEYVEACINQEENTGVISDDFYKGLENFQNNCWLNSIIQTVYNDETFFNILSNSNSEEQYIQKLKSLCIKMKMSSEKTINPIEYDLNFGITDQEDIATFYDSFISKLCECDSKFNYTKIIILSHFDIKCVDQIETRHTRLAIPKDKMERFSYIPLLLNYENLILSAKEFFGKCDINYTINNKIYQLTKTQSLPNMPKMLVFQIARVFYDEKSQCRIKNTKQFIFPIQFNINEIFPESESTFYYLHSIILHSGSCDNGHFYTFVLNKDQNSFIEYNDTIVQFRDLKSALLQSYGGDSTGSQAVMLFYVTDKEVEHQSLDITFESKEHSNDYHIQDKEVDDISFENENKVVILNSKSKVAIDQLAKEANKEIEKIHKHHELDSTDNSTIPIEVHLYAASLEQKKNDALQQKEQPNTKTEEKSKRNYVFYSKSSKETLQRLYRLNGEEQDAKWYALNSNINISTTKKYLEKIKNGSFKIEDPLHKGGNKTKVTEEMAEEINRILNEDPTTSLERMAKIFMENNKKMPVEDRIPEKDLPSARSIQRFYKSIKCKEMFGHTFSFNRIYTRGSNANTDPNLKLRQERILNLVKYIQKGALWVSVDESSWNINYVLQKRLKGWGPTGKKKIYHLKRFSFTVTAITAITNSGKSFSFLVKGTVNKEVFNIFLKKMMKAFETDGVLVVFLDNCGVHNDTEEIIQAMGHIAIFNAPNSPELNPIERIFNVWKDRVADECKNWANDKDILETIQKVFNSLEPDLIRRTMESIKMEPWYDALNRNIQ